MDIYNTAEHSECPHCKPYPFNKRDDIEDIPCVYASPDIMSENYTEEDDENTTVLLCNDENWE